MAWRLEPPAYRDSELQDMHYVCLDFSVERVFIRINVVRLASSQTQIDVRRVYGESSVSVV